MIIRKQNQPSPQSGQAGFTLIESLLAILIVSILLVALSPVLVLAVATRVQARRVEVGTQAARTYIDRVKTGIIGAGATAITPLPTITKTKPSDVPAPTGGVLSCDLTTKLCNADPKVMLYCVPGDPSKVVTDPTKLCDKNSVTDMVVQAFTYQKNAATTPDPSQGYVLGVRVYRADAFKESGSLKTAEKDQAKNQAFSGGLGDRKAPIVEITTEIASKSTSYLNYCDRLKPTDPADNQASKCE